MKFYRKSDVEILIKKLQSGECLPIFAEQALEAFAKIEPISVSEFNERETEEQFYKWGVEQNPGPADNYNKKADTFVAGVKWENERIRKLMEGK